MANSNDKGKINTIQRPNDERLKELMDKTDNEALKKSIDEKLKNINQPFNK